jgi:hypothetical protein
MTVFVYVIDGVHVKDDTKSHVLLNSSLTLPFLFRFNEGI